MMLNTSCLQMNYDPLALSFTLVEPFDKTCLLVVNRAVAFTGLKVHSHDTLVSRSS